VEGGWRFEASRAGMPRLGKRGTAGGRHSGDEPRAEVVAQRQRQRDRKNHITYINRRTIEKRPRLGLVGGGRVPPRNRGAPTRR
jgi:hypothetical protein